MFCAGAQAVVALRQRPFSAATTASKPARNGAPRGSDLERPGSIGGSPCNTASVHPAPPALVIPRSRQAQSRQLRRLRIAIVFQSIAVGVQLVAAVVLTLVVAAAGAIFFVTAVLYALILGLYVRIYSVHAAMRNLRLVFSADGVAYASDAGTFAAPWTAVKRISSRRGRYVRVRVPRWTGPIGSFGMFGELVVPFDDTGLTWHDIRQAAACFSNGTVIPR